MNEQPLLSYIVLSYNYASYIGTALRSILEQSVQDFEIVVVDDCSTDDSLAVIRSFDDNRIRLLINEQNIGGAASYNRAVEAARGKWLVNLDADDWLAPDKAAIQLEALDANPDIDIIGSYITVLDHEGAPHPSARKLEQATNQPHAFNQLDTWIGANWLCRSSTMVRRSAHLRIGLDDPTMVRAPDYELWTRALRSGCKFAMVQQPFTFVRQHAQGVTHADPLGTLLEVSYAMVRNLIPLAETRGLNASIEKIISWVARHRELGRLAPIEAYRLLGIIMTSHPVGNFTSFRAALSDDGNALLAHVGRRCLSLFGEGTNHGLLMSRVEKFEKDIELYIEARDYWRTQAKNWENAYRNDVGDVAK